jgi:Tol biopolymer transport system component
MNADGSRQTRLTDTSMHALNPLWSRDGCSIIFGAFSADWQAGALYAIRTDGSRLIRLTSTDRWLQWVQR